MYIYIIILLIIFILLIFYNNKVIENFNNINNILPNLYYINLKHRTDRNKHILSELDKIKYPKNKIIRINAIKHKIGSTGCGLSHIKALELALKQKQDINYIIILEDDFSWKYNNSYTKNILYNALKSETNWNMILLSCNGSTEKYNKYLNKVKNCQTASGYIIKISYIPILLKLWKKDMNKRLNNKKTLCIDQSWKKLQWDKWYITNPILGKQIESYSDIEKKKVNYGV